MKLRTWAEIDLTAIQHNVRAIREFVGPGFGVMAVVKANAYGHGTVECARAAVEAGADWLVVAAVEEADELRRSLLEAPICLISPFLPDDAATIVELSVTPFVSTLQQAAALDKAARRSGKCAQAHLEIDTGMGRSGALPDQIPELSASLNRFEYLKITGAATHFASEEDPEFCRLQLSLFKDALTAARAAGLPIETVHCANSGALARYRDALFTHVRAGLLMYGIRPSEPLSQPVVRPVLSLKTRIALIRDLPVGSSISYGRTRILDRPSRVATIPVGYGDGYPRALSNRGCVLIRGRRAPILGRVCMDMVMVDVTDIPDPEAGDEVVLIGRQGDVQITVEEIARLIDTTEHDVTTRLTERVDRDIVRN